VPPVDPRPAPSRQPWYLNPYAHLALNSLFTAVAYLLLKRGAMGTAGVPVPHGLEWTGIAVLGSGWTWAAIACHIAALGSWLLALRWIPLSLAAPLANGEHVLIPLGAWILLGESVGMLRWCGIGMILAGIGVIVRSRELGNYIHVEDAGVDPAGPGRPGGGPDRA
jgi:drug/metabolite transporter (DMT)-like permease